MFIRPATVAFASQRDDVKIAHRFIGGNDDPNVAEPHRDSAKIANRLIGGNDDDKSGPSPVGTNEFSYG